MKHQSHFEKLVLNIVVTPQADYKSNLTKQLKIVLHTTITLFGLMEPQVRHTHIIAAPRDIVFKENN